MLSIPDGLGALVLKGAAYMEDLRDRERHLYDAAVLACAVTDPIGDRARMIGNDRKRIAALWKVLGVCCQITSNCRAWCAAFVQGALFAGRQNLFRHICPAMQLRRRSWHRSCFS